jgi:hypothetical protein
MALSFDGATSYINCGTGSSLNLTGALSIMQWVKINTVGGYYRQMGKFHIDSGYVYRGYILQLTSSGIVDATFGIGTAYGSFRRNSNAEVDNNVWHHIAAVYSPSSRCDVYIDGVLDNGTLSGSIGASFTAATEPFQIGRFKYDPTGVYLYGGGAMADCRVYNRALADGEILTIAKARGGDLIFNGLVSCWPLISQEGTVPSGAGSIRDIRGVNHGTPTSLWESQASPHLIG